MPLPSHADILKTIRGNPTRFGVSTAVDLDVDLDLDISKDRPRGLPSNEDIINTIKTSPSKFGVSSGVASALSSDLGVYKKPVEEEEKKRGGFFGGLRDIASDIFTGFKKLPARTAVEVVNLFTSTLDVAADAMANSLERDFRDPLILRVGKPPKGVKDLFTPEKNKELADRWANFYDESVGKKTENIKKFTQSLREAESIKPTEEWVNASLSEKLTKHIFETVFYIGPGVISSLGVFALNIQLGFAVSAGSVADDVKTSAMDVGIDEQKAERLGLGSGLLIGAIDKIVPDELFGPREKGQFMRGLARRLVVKTSLKEFGTEIVQEEVQIGVESTFREDLGWDEVKTRTAMAGLGGLLGGAGAQVTVNFANQIKQGNIAGITEEDIKKVEAKKEIAKTEQLRGLEEIAREDNADKLISAEDFADVRFGTTPDAQIGIIDADRITPRDSVDVESAEFKALETDIKENGIKEPVIVNVSEDKTIETFEGSNRTVIAQRNNLKVPILVAEGNIEGLITVGDLFEAVKTEAVPIVEEVKEMKEVPTTIEEGETEIIKVYKENIDVVEKAMGEVFAELEISEAGARVSTEDGTVGIPSTFPKWIPKSLRSKRLFQKVMEGLSINNLKYPGENKSRQRELFDALLDEVDTRAGIDTTKTRDVIMEAYAKERPEEITDRGVKRGKKEPVTKKKKIVPKVIPAKKAEEVIKVPPTQLPVGEGKEKVSRLQARVMGKLDALKTSDVQLLKEELGLTTYNQMNKADQVAKASEYVVNNQEDALKVLKGELNPPEGVLINSIYVAMKELGAADTELATKIATLSATRMGQEISVLSEVDEKNPVTMMENIVKTRIEAFEKRTRKRASDKIKQEVKKIDVEQKAPSSRQWDSFLESIRC